MMMMMMIIPVKVLALGLDVGHAITGLAFTHLARGLFLCGTHV